MTNDLLIPRRVRPRGRPGLVGPSPRRRSAARVARRRSRRTASLMEQVIARYLQHAPAVYDATEAYPPVGVNLLA